MEKEKPKIGQSYHDFLKEEPANLSRAQKREIAQQEQNLSLLDVADINPCLLRLGSFEHSPHNRIRNLAITYRRQATYEDYCQRLFGAIPDLKNRIDELLMNEASMFSLPTLQDLPDFEDLLLRKYLTFWMQYEDPDAVELAYSDPHFMILASRRAVNTQLSQDPKQFHPTQDNLHRCVFSEMKMAIFNHVAGTRNDFDASPQQVTEAWLIDNQFYQPPRAKHSLTYCRGLLRDIDANYPLTAREKTKSRRAGGSFVDSFHSDYPQIAHQFLEVVRTGEYRHEFLQETHDARRQAALGNLGIYNLVFDRLKRYLSESQPRPYVNHYIDVPDLDLAMRYLIHHEAESFYKMHLTERRQADQDLHGMHLSKIWQKP